MSTTTFISYRTACYFAGTLIACFVTQAALGESPPQAWRPPNGTPVAPIRTTAPQKPAPQANQQSAAPAKLQQVSASSSAGKSISRLPNEHKQIWQEYDISPYTTRVDSNGAPPQQAIVDWILRDTGYASWHSDVVAVLSGTPRSLRVYHTPEMQQAVARAASVHTRIPHRHRHALCCGRRDGRRAPG